MGVAERDRGNRAQETGQYVKIKYVRIIGDWRSWLARAVWDREAGGSSPLSPTMNEITSFYEPVPGFI